MLLDKWIKLLESNYSKFDEWHKGLHTESSSLYWAIRASRFCVVFVSGVFATILITNIYPNLDLHWKGAIMITLRWIFGIAIFAILCFWDWRQNKNFSGKPWLLTFSVSILFLIVRIQHHLETTKFSSSLDLMNAYYSKVIQQTNLYFDSEISATNAYYSSLKSNYDVAELTITNYEDPNFRRDLYWIWAGKELDALNYTSAAVCYGLGLEADNEKALYLHLGLQFKPRYFFSCFMTNPVDERVPLLRSNLDDTFQRLEAYPMQENNRQQFAFAQSDLENVIYPKAPTEQSRKVIEDVIAKAKRFRAAQTPPF